jgi:hypothetical protein
VDEQVHKETLQNGSEAVCHLDEPDQQLHSFLSNATVLSKYSQEELLNILEFAVPPHWRKAFDFRDNLPTCDDKARFISECEPIEKIKCPRQESMTAVTMTAQAAKKKQVCKI